MQTKGKRRNWVRWICLFVLLAILIGAIVLDWDLILSAFHVKGAENAASSELTGKTAAQVVDMMGIGWNIGNTFDATGGIGASHETSWGNPKVTKELIHAVKEGGFNVIRIPVTWAQEIDKNNNFKIREDFLARVKEVVDWCCEEDLFVILNVHHESWLNIKALDKEYRTVGVELEAVWGQIAEYFAEYDQHLIFEGMNEPRTVGSSMEWMGGTKEERKTVNKYARDFVKTVRASGGKNADRTLIVTSYAASADSVALNDMSVPSGKNIVFSVHYYAPWNFAEGNETVFTESGKGELDAKFSELKQKFIDKGIPVIIDEFGCVNAADAATRSSYYTYYVSAAKSKGIKCFVWDNGKMSGESSFGIFNRGALAWEGNILSAIMEGAK